MIFKFYPDWNQQATAGLLADSRQIANRARAEAASYKNTFGTEVPTKMVNKRYASFNLSTNINTHENE